ncbi:hypothetical protein GCM10023257_11590 [Streptomyces hyderabadensis]|uniref:Barstar (barnase inhibitor) domain-containing protein n=1 Tax=Streptomyces hyderabadensis TaxID=598549 RepID=A0ABP9HQP3_9ACTN
MVPKKTETELEVDLRGRSIETLDDFWDAVAEPCGLPEWFGRNTEAWRDTIQTRGISDVIDSYDVLVVHVDKRGVFAARNREARALRSAFAGRQSRPLLRSRSSQWTPRSSPLRSPVRSASSYRVWNRSAQVASRNWRASLALRGWKRLGRGVVV